MNVKLQALGYLMMSLILINDKIVDPNIIAPN